MKYGMVATYHLGCGLGADYGAAGVGAQGGDRDGEEGGHFWWGFELIVRISDGMIKQYSRQAMMVMVVDIRRCLVWMRRRRGRDMDCRSCLGSAERDGSNPRQWGGGGCSPEQLIPVRFPLFRVQEMILPPVYLFCTLHSQLAGKCGVEPTKLVAGLKQLACDSPLRHQDPQDNTSRQTMPCELMIQISWDSPKRRNPRI